MAIYEIILGQGGERLQAKASVILDSVIIDKNKAIEQAKKSAQKNKFIKISVWEFKVKKGNVNNGKCIMEV